MLPANDIENLVCVESTRVYKITQDVFVSDANYIAPLYSVCALVTNFRLRTFATGNESTIINHKQNFSCDTGFE